MLKRFMGGPTRIRTESIEIEYNGRLIRWGNRMMKLADLFVDDRFQRSLSEREAERIAGAWDQTLVGLICVSIQSNGKGSVLDGQHRSRAAHILGHEEIACEFFEGLRYTEEATIFAERNARRRTPKATALYKARVAGGDEVAIAVNRIMGELGLAVLTEKAGGSTRKDNTQYSAIVSLEWLLKLGVLRQTLELQRAAWPDEPAARENGTLLAIGTVLWNAEAKIDRERWRKQMCTVPLNPMIKAAKDLHSGIGRPMWQHLAQIIANAYDKGLPKTGSARIDMLRMPPGVVKGSRVTTSGGTST